MKSKLSYNFPNKNEADEGEGPQKRVPRNALAAMSGNRGDVSCLGRKPGHWRRQRVCAMKFDLPMSGSIGDSTPGFVLA